MKKLVRLLFDFGAVNITDDDCEQQVPSVVYQWGKIHLGDPWSGWPRSAVSVDRLQAVALVSQWPITTRWR